MRYAASYNDVVLYELYRVDLGKEIFATGRWLRTEMMKFGSLLCLSADGYKDQILFAKVVYRPNGW